MNHLIVLFGHVGCGKTTLIKRFLEQNENFVSLDVFDYIKKYKDKTGHIEPEKTLVAYNELYNKLSTVKDNIILELGTNHGKLNIENLSRLSNNFSAKIIFCLLDTKICIKRVIARGKINPVEKIHKKDLLAKFKRRFPEEQMNLAKEHDLSYITLDMSLPLEKKLEIIDNLLIKNLTN